MKLTVGFPNNQIPDFSAHICNVSAQSPQYHGNPRAHHPDAAIMRHSNPWITSCLPSEYRSPSIDNPEIWTHLYGIDQTLIISSTDECRSHTNETVHETLMQIFINMRKMPTIPIFRRTWIWQRLQNYVKSITLDVQVSALNDKDRSWIKQAFAM